jgi:LuxR family transcriptional regulator, maltose regulon positive regulatory protein
MTVCRRLRRARRTPSGVCFPFVESLEPLGSLQPAAFTITKIQPPRLRTNLIARGALERRLAGAIAARRLTLLSAPAGFGKTALLTRQLASLSKDVAVAWIGADVDDDLHRFLGCLFAALEPFDLPWRTAPEGLVAAAVTVGRERRAVATELLNALAAAEVGRGLIVVDDAHRIVDKAVFEFIDLMLERLPDQWGIVISSRVDPPLALARLRAQDEVAELHQADLRFDEHEVAALIKAAGGGPDAAQLLKRTGGWAAGLRLALNAAQQGFAAPASAPRLDRHVFDYLAAEVIDDLPGELREFLLRCSVLAELKAERCAAVSGNARAGLLLEDVERRGLFVSAVEAPEPALTLHDLFRDCLADRLRREHPDAIPQLLRRAADTEPDPIRRLSFLLRAGAWSEAESVLESVAAELVAASAIEPVQRLLDQFPQELRERSPMLALVRGQVLWAQWDWRGTAEAMRRAHEGFDAIGDERRRLRAQVFEAIALDGSGLIPESEARLAELSLEGADLETRALALALRTWHAIDGGRFRDVANRYSDVLEVLEQTDELQLWYQCFQRPLYTWMPGMSAPLARFVDGVMRRNGDTPSQMRALAFVMAAWLALWRGELPQALERVAQAQEDARWLGLPVRLRMFVNSVRAAVSAATGDRDAALESLAVLLAYFDSAPLSGPRAQPTSMYAHYLFYAVRLADTLGDADALREFAGRMPPAERITNFAVLRAPLATLPARLAALDSQFEEACARWAEVLQEDAALDVLGLAQESRLRYAHTLIALDRVADAAATLRPLFAHVAKSGEIGGVVLAGRAVLRTLAAADWRGTLEWTEQATLTAWAQRFGGAAGAPEQLLLDGAPLSPRELQVLARIAAGDSNKLIARAFDLSPHTVKRHVANILDKLGVGSRSEAAQWYRERR